jgi:hypothetical protein
MSLIPVQILQNCASSSYKLRGMPVAELLFAPLRHCRRTHQLALRMLASLPREWDPAGAMLTECCALFRLSISFQSLEAEAQTDAFCRSFVNDNPSWDAPGRVPQAECHAEWLGSQGYRVVLCRDALLVISPSAPAAAKSGLGSRIGGLALKKPNQLVDCIMLETVTVKHDGKTTLLLECTGRGPTPMRLGLPEAQFEPWLHLLTRAVADKASSRLGMDVARVLRVEVTVSTPFLSFFKKFTPFPLFFQKFGIYLLCSCCILLFFFQKFTPF